MIRALAKTPSPYATVIASEIFQTGLILSECAPLFRSSLGTGSLASSG